MSKIDGIAFIHGGAHGAWDWSDVRQQLLIPSIAIDLPGRGEPDEVLAKITLDDWVNHSVEQIERQDWQNVMLVGHSLAGITMPGVAARLSDRVAHVVYITCQTPPEGTSAYDNMPPGLRDIVLQDNVFRPKATHMGVSGAMLRLCEEKTCNDAGQPFRTPITRKPIAHIPSTYVRIIEDEVLSDARQKQIIDEMKPTFEIPLHGYHFAHISKPDMICGVLSTIAAMTPPKGVATHSA
jgi:pimeloyl-ACP methyl ester carboxylesterase